MIAAAKTTAKIPEKIYIGAPWKGILADAIGSPKRVDIDWLISCWYWPIAARVWGSKRKSEESMPKI